MNSNINTILLCTDFSKLSDNALATAISICKRQPAKLQIMHVVENRFLLSPTEMYAAAIYIVPGLEEIAKEKMEALKTRILKIHQIKAETRLIFGNPADSIRDYAIEIAADLIVMGTHGASGFRKLFMGSTAYSVIKNTTIPVMTIPGKKNIISFKNILFPLRATKGVADKYDFVAPIIQKNESRLYILGLSKPSESYDHGQIEEEIKRVAESLRESRVCYESSHKVTRNFASEVIKMAKKEKSDLIVINASLDYNWREYFIGPYTQQIINQSPIPVLSFRTASPPDVLLNEAKHEFSYTPKLGFSV